MIILESELEMTTAAVADIALNFPQAIDLLNEYNLDYCCNGKKNFVGVCKSRQLNPETIWNEIMEKKQLASSDSRLKFQNWEPALLIDFIVQHHHSYVRESLPRITELLNKVCSVHANDSPQLAEIRNLFDQVAEELLEHMPKEEVVLFPAIRRITGKTNNGVSSASINVQAPIVTMEHEHEAVGDLVKRIRILTDQYTPPLHACPTFQLTYRLLKEFDHDLMQHIHLENNILFPMVRTARQEVFG